MDSPLLPNKLNQVMAFISSLYKFTFVLIFCLCTSLGYSQSLYPPKVQSPNTAALGTFGEVPVSLFTGTPNISIPLYELKYGSIKVPINLRYNAAGVKPGQMPGWVGSGWDLESYGTISRQMKGILDEFNQDAVLPNQTFYYPNQSASTPSGADLANAVNWNTPSTLYYDFVGTQGGDVEADEFSFNVMGHSGKFYYSGAAKGWQVVSEENIQVELLGFIEPAQIINAIKSFTIPVQNVAISKDQSRMFSGFVLTTPDGFKYTFGDIFGDGNGIEFFSSFMPQFGGPNAYATPNYIADTWVLRKIEDPLKNTVSFGYGRDKVTCDLKLIFADGGFDAGPANTSSGLFSSFLAQNNWSNSNTGRIDKNEHQGMFHWPLYLSYISSANEMVSFYAGDANSYRYTSDQITYTNSQSKNFVNHDDLLINDIANQSYIKWKQLNKIIVRDIPGNVGLTPPSTLPKITRQFAFTYSNTSSQRLMLGSLQLLDNQGTGNVIGQYQFSYYIDLISRNPNLVADGNFTDHWGYFNNVDLHLGQGGDIYPGKQPAPYEATDELLNKIIYPTGGYTQFTWESNDYATVVSSLDRQSLVQYQYVSNGPLSGAGGGPRISTIKNYASDNTLLTGKNYYYKKNYVAGVPMNTLTSSGVLNGVPQYYFQVNGRSGYGGGVYAYNRGSLYGTQNYGYTGGGSPVGYDEVTEAELDGSYTKTYFTNYGTDANGVSHYDKTPSGYLGWQSGDTYFPFSSLGLERGKPISVLRYRSDNTLLQSETFTYRSDAGRFNSSVNLIDKDFLGGFQGSGIFILASARSAFNYSYYPVAKTTTTYDQAGVNPVTVTENYTNYNSNNLLTAKNTVNSRGETVTTTYTYPTDYPSTAPYSNMISSSNHVLDPVISTSVTTVPLGSGSPVPVSTVTKNYSEPFTGIYVPQNLQIQVGSNTAEIREQINSFDSNGHPLEVQKPNGIKEAFLWGTNSQFLLAHVVGADYSTASSLVDPSILNKAGMGTGSAQLSDADLRTELNKLRTGLPNAMVTTYTYSVGVGITSETDPNGKTTYYNYDAYNRLIVVRDHDKNILKRFCYNYAGQPENCTVAMFGNTAKSASFTSTNSCATGTTQFTGNYTIPANTYYDLDQPSADALATAALNSQGQAWANSIPCQASLTETNTTSNEWVGSFTNTASNVVYSFYFYPNSSPAALVTVPVGTYNLVLTPHYTQSSPVYLTFNGSTYTGTSFSQSNISIGSGFNMSLASSYGNTAKTASFTSANSCAAGTTKFTGNYTIPANTYFAVDQATADAQATAAMNSQGQAWVNSIPCQALITETNATSNEWEGSFTNTSTNVAYSFSFYPNSSPQSLVTVPVGTYNIVVSPHYTQSSSVYLTFNGSTYSGTSFSMSNISITTGSNMNVTNPVGNTVKTGSFTGGSCPAGSTPATISYTIPANTYYAVDQATADAQATAALNSQGQAAANATPCQVVISGTNTTAASWSGSMTNTATNVSYSLGTITSGTLANPIVTVPAGTYNINLTPSPSQSTAQNITINGTTYSGTTFSLTNISISTATTLKLTAPASGSCSIVMYSGWVSPSGSVSSSGSSVNGGLSFYSTNTFMSVGYTYTIGTINGGCRPSGTRTFTVSPFLVTVDPDGTLSVQPTSGTTIPPNTSKSISLFYSL